MAIVGISSIQPDQTVEWNDEEYMRNIRFIANQYNIKSNQLPVFDNGTYSTPNSPTSVNEYIDNLRYIYGVQIPADYNFFLMDVKGNNTAVPMMRGLDIKKMFDHIHGQAYKMIEPITKKIKVTAYSKNAISQKKEMMNYIKMMADKKTFFKLIEVETGYGFQPVDRDFKTQVEVDKYFENFQDAMEIAFMNLAKDACYVNDFQVKLPKIADHVIIGNVGTIEVVYRNGRARWNVIPPQLNIVDYSKEDDQHLADDYAGYVQAYSIPELITTYEFNEIELEELKSIARAGAGSPYWQNLATLGNMNGMNWWNIDNGVPKVMVVKGQWKSVERKEEGWLEVNREADLIGNKYLRNQKISDDQLYDLKDRSKKRLRFITVTPNILAGTSMSIVSLLKRFQNLKDAFTTKSIQMASNAIGKSVIIRSSKLPDGMRSPEVISQLKQANVVVIDDDAEDEETSNQKLVEAIDLTLDPSIGAIMDIVKYYDFVMADIMNTPAVVRGQLGGYQSAKNVDTSMNNSTMGMTYFYNNIKLFNNRLLTYSADLMKFMAPNDEQGQEALSLIVGDGVAEMMSMEVIRAIQFEDMLLSLDSNDYTTIEDKQRYEAFILQFAATGQTSFKDYIMVDKLDSKTEIINYLEAEDYKKEKAKAEAREAELMAANANAKVNANAQMANTMMQNQQQPPQQ